MSNNETKPPNLTLTESAAIATDLYRKVLQTTASFAEKSICDRNDVEYSADASSTVGEDLAYWMGAILTGNLYAAAYLGSGIVQWMRATYPQHNALRFLSVAPTITLRVYTATLEDVNTVLSQTGVRFVKGDGYNQRCYDSLDLDNIAEAYAGAVEIEDAPAQYLADDRRKAVLAEIKRQLAFAGRIPAMLCRECSCLRAVDEFPMPDLVCLSCGGRDTHLKEL